MKNCNEQVITFQNDLRNGMTLEDALQKHGLSFKEACILCHKTTSIRGTRNGEYHHIYKHFDGRFRVSREVNKKRYTVMVGTLENAVIIRDYLDMHGWNEENVKYVKEKL